MEESKKKILFFTDLVAWQKGHFLVLEIYSMTKGFPKDEIFGLVSQMRRCVVSITSNIAEGFSRQSYKERAQFYSMAQGSLTELQNQLLIAHDVNYISGVIFKKIMGMADEVHRLINGLIKRSKSFV